jgi:hypothetical protein
MRESASSVADAATISTENGVSAAAHRLPTRHQCVQLHVGLSALPADARPDLE